MAKYARKHKTRHNARTSKMFGTGNMQFASAKRKRNYHNSRGGGQM